MSTFEDFLMDCLARGETTVRLVPRVRDDGGTAFYAHGEPASGSSETFDAVAVGDTVINMTQPEMPEAPPCPMPAPVLDDYLSESEIKALDAPEATGDPMADEDFAFSEASAADVGAALDAEEAAAPSDMPDDEYIARLADDEVV